MDETISRIFDLPFEERIHILAALRSQPDRVVVMEPAYSETYADFITSISEGHVDLAASAFWTENKIALQAALSENVLAELISQHRYFA